MHYATKAVGEVSGYRLVDEVCTELGLSRSQMLGRINNGDVRVFRHPRDRRIKLIPIEDVERLMRPVPDRPRPQQRV
jgi:hypothetical protein